MNAFPPQNNYGKISLHVAVNTHKLVGGITLPEGGGERNTTREAFDTYGAGEWGMMLPSLGLIHLLCCRTL